MDSNPSSDAVLARRLRIADGFAFLDPWARRANRESSRCCLLPENRRRRKVDPLSGAGSVGVPRSEPRRLPGIGHQRLLVGPAAPPKRSVGFRGEMGGDPATRRGAVVDAEDVPCGGDHGA